MEAIRVEGVTRAFGGVRAVQGVSFCAQVGERLMIIGPNGAGKTTLFNLLAGQLKPTSGRVYLDGRDITGTSTHRRVQLGIARSFQVSTLLTQLSVMDNLLLALHGRRRSRFQMFRGMSAYSGLRAEADALLERMGLLAQRDELAGALAYGEQRKLELAVTEALRPKVILLDEPSAGLTQSESADIAARLLELGREVTVIMVAHDMELVFSMAERIIVLHQGAIVAEGSPEEIRTNAKVREVYMGEDSVQDA